MSIAKTSTKEEKAKVFEMVLSSPDMAENSKLSFKLSRQNVLVLARLLETGIPDPKVILRMMFLVSCLLNLR